ncbi:MAG TPA: hypothetical protein VJ385_21555 [Fibrobacteria bacterium]|nr:hypothetical protein [Fibrobacteria bacterium]
MTESFLDAQEKKRLGWKRLQPGNPLVASIIAVRNEKVVLGKRAEDAFGERTLGFAVLPDAYGKRPVRSQRGQGDT